MTFVDSPLFIKNNNLLISVSCERFPRAVRKPPRRKLLRGLTWTRFSRWKDIGRTVIRPISLRRVTAGADVPRRIPLQSLACLNQQLNTTYLKMKTRKRHSLKSGSSIPL